MWNLFRKKNVDFENNDLKDFFILIQKLKQYNYRKNNITFSIILGVNIKIKRLKQKYNKLFEIQIPDSLKMGVPSDMDEKLTRSEKKELLKSIKELEYQILEYSI